MLGLRRPAGRQQGSFFGDAWAQAARRPSARSVLFWMLGPSRPAGRQQGAFLEDAWAQRPTSGEPAFPSVSGETSGGLSCLSSFIPPKSVGKPTIYQIYLLFVVFSCFCFCSTHNRTHHALIPEKKGCTGAPDKIVSTCKSTHARCSAYSEQCSKK